MESKGLGNSGNSTVRFCEADLKICDLCGWLNLNTNTICFVCGWHGHFERNAEVIHASVELAERRYGRLDLRHFTDMRTYQAQPLSQLARLYAWCRRLLQPFRR